MIELPEKALSIRQPWANAILFHGKPIENRPRRTNYRGRIAIHASLYDNWEYWKWSKESIEQAAGHAVTVPYPTDLLRGGIIGSVEIIDCVDNSDSPWFFGPYGYVLANPEPCEFIPVKGQLGFFPWRKNLPQDSSLR